MIQNLIDRLEKVKKTGEGRWMARCPSHQDNKASLGITEKDGKILIHCFAGCNTHVVLGGIGLTINDLFEKRLPHSKPMKRRWSAHQILLALGESMSMVALYLERKRHQALTNEEEQVFQRHMNHVILLCHEGTKE